MIETKSKIKELVELIRLLMRSVNDDSARISRRFGLTELQSAVLRNVTVDGPTSSVQMSRKLFVSPSNMTGIVDRLVGKGLVERIPKPGDRRVVLISLTERGLAVGLELPDPIERKLTHGLAGFEEAEIEALSRIIRQIIDILEAEVAEDIPPESALEAKVSGALRG